MGVTSDKGYGTPHQKERAAWAPFVAAGQVRCARCGLVIPVGAPWDLGHDDFDRSRYAGPEHRKCNRGAPSLRRQGRLGPRRRFTSESW